MPLRFPLIPSFNPATAHPDAIPGDPRPTLRTLYDSDPRLPFRIEAARDALACEHTHPRARAASRTDSPMQLIMSACWSDDEPACPSDAPLGPIHTLTGTTLTVLDA